MSRKSRPASPSSGADSPGLRLFRREGASRVLGPGLRAVLWLQGCSIRCEGCLVPRAWPADGGEAEVAEVAAWVLAQPGIEGITLTGGEPMEQASALVLLLDSIRAERNLGVVCYTGHVWEGLRAPSQRALLERIDLLIDGPYRVDLHGDLLWRASANQRLLALTSRYQGDLPGPGREDCGAGLEFRLEADGRLAFTGVPPWPGYLHSLPVAGAAS